jgi:hypothetical protein
MDVSKEHNAAIISMTRISLIGTMIAVISKLSMLSDLNELSIYVLVGGLSTASVV